jgi:hypothetical protein
MAVGIAFVFVGVARAMEAIGFEHTVIDCIVAATVATVVMTLASKA